MNVIKLRRKREILAPVIWLSLLNLTLLAMLDVIFLMDARQRQSATTDWTALCLIHIGLLAMMVLLWSLVLPNCLAVYTEEGIKWPSITGYRLMRWSEIISVEDTHPFMNGRKVILKSAHRKIVVNPRLFVTEVEVMDELKQRIPEGLWVKAKWG